MSAVRVPTPAEVEEAREALGHHIRETPVWEWQSATLAERLGGDTRVFLKMELFQHAGTFKPRGALTTMRGLPSVELARGVTTVSAGNHAMATAYAARALGATAKVVMPRTASPARVRASQGLGAEVVLVDDIHEAFDEVERIRSEEGRVFVHPFEGESITRGTATLGLELCRQLPEFDAVVVPIGGGGLCSGVASYVKQLHPRCEVLGVEPEGADTMSRSFAAGQPVAIDRVRTIADSLAPPHAAPYSFEVCRSYVDELALVNDADLCRALALLFREMKLAVEPAGAASTAALLGPFAQRLRGKRVVLVLCGTNIDAETFATHLAAGSG